MCVLQLEPPQHSCLHFEIVECQGDPLEQDRVGSHMPPYRGYMPGISRFPTGTLQELQSSIAIVWLSNVMQK